MLQEKKIDAPDMKIKPAGIYTPVLERNIPSTKAIVCSGSILSTASSGIGLALGKSMQ